MMESDLMVGLIAALSLFVGLHSVPAIPTLRSGIIRTVGRTTYLAVYSAVSTVALVWLFYEALNTDYVELWSTAAWQVHVTFVLAPLGLFLVISGLISRNPFSVAIRHDDDAPGAIVGITRHPVLWGFLLWSAGHVFPNGDLRSAILFGGFAAFSLGGMLMAERRSRRKLGARWETMARDTSVIPLVANLTARRFPRADWPMFVGFVLSLALTAWLLLGGHAALVGADPVTTLQSLQ